MLLAVFKKTLICKISLRSSQDSFGTAFLKTPLALFLTLTTTQFQAMIRELLAKFIRCARTSVRVAGDSEPTLAAGDAGDRAQLPTRGQHPQTAAPARHRACQVSKVLVVVVHLQKKQSLGTFQAKSLSPLRRHKSEIEEICRGASRELELEIELRVIEEEWSEQVPPSVLYAG